MRKKFSYFLAFIFVVAFTFYLLQIGKIDPSSITGTYNSINKALSDTVNKPFSVLNQGVSKQQTSTLDKTKEITLEQVNNLGYTFYLGQIDNPSAAPISDTMKNDITRIVYNSKFPKSLLEKVPIIFVNNLALKPGQYIATPSGNMKVMDFGAGFLYEGGVYATYESGNFIIYINNDVLAKDSLTNILTHELGHAIGSTLTGADWTKYYGLRNIPIGTPRESGLWNLSPAEDFAEVYKNTFTGLGVRTYYGLLLPANFTMAGILEHTCGNTYTQIYNSELATIEKASPPSTCSPGDVGWPICDSGVAVRQAQQKSAEDTTNSNAKVQDCRRNVMAHPDQYPNDWQYGLAPYKSTVGPQTKEFINAAISKLN